MRDRSRLGTQPPFSDRNEEAPDDQPVLGLSVRLDRPFHELKQFLLAEFERAYLLRVLEEATMNISMASRSSGLSRKHIRTLMSKHGMATRRDLVLEDDEIEDPREPDVQRE